MTAFLLRPAAVADLRKAYHWYQSERTGLGEEFLQAVRAAVERVAASPRVYSVIHRDTRRVLVRRFPYGLFFRIVDGHHRLRRLLPPSSKTGVVATAKVMANPTMKLSVD